MYYFFNDEVKFLFKYLFGKTELTQYDKNIRDGYMSDLKKSIIATCFCRNIGHYWYPLFNNSLRMKALNNEEIFFNSESECKSFLTI